MVGNNISDVVKVLQSNVGLIVYCVLHLREYSVLLQFCNMKLFLIMQLVYLRCLATFLFT